MTTDPTMVIEGECKGAHLDKRTYLPGIVIKCKCPKCGALDTTDLSHEYLSYPTVGEPYRVTGYCVSCEHEWYIGSVVVNLTLSVFTEPGEAPVEDANTRQAKLTVASLLDGLESPLRAAVRGELSPDDCTHEDADCALNALQRVLRSSSGA
jgi:hypothetical protein